MVQFSHPYMTTGKNIALTTRTFAGKVTKTMTNQDSILKSWDTVIAFLPRSKRFLIPGLQLLSAVSWESKKIKSVTASTFARSLGLSKYYSLMSQEVKSNYIFLFCIIFCFPRVSFFFSICLLLFVSVMNSLQILQHTWKTLLKNFLTFDTSGCPSVTFLSPEGIAWQHPIRPCWFFSGQLPSCWVGAFFLPFLQGLPFVHCSHEVL